MQQAARPGPSARSGRPRGSPAHRRGSHLTAASADTQFAAPEHGWLAYAKIPGVPLLDLPEARRLAHGAAIAATVGQLLTALHATPADRMAELVDTDSPSLADWQAEAAQTYGTTAGQVPASHRRSVEAFLSAPPPADADTRAFSHNDLGIEHVLVDAGTGTVTGVIDWSDAAIVDPAYDFGLLYRDLGPAALDAAFRSYRTEADNVAALRQRAVFYARCTVFEDIAYGTETAQPKYLDKSRTAMQWLFPLPLSAR